MIRDALFEETGRLTEIANNYLIANPLAYPGDLQEGQMPYTEEDVGSLPFGTQWIMLVKEVEGEIVAFMKGRLQPNGRCSIDMFFADPSQPANERLIWIYELTKELATRTKAMGGNEVYGKINTRNAVMLNAYGPFDNRYETDTDWGGYTHLYDSADDVIAKCQTWLQANAN